MVCGKIDILQDLKKVRCISGQLGEHQKQQKMLRLLQNGDCRRKGNKMNKVLMKKTKERCKQFLVENGWKHDVDNDDGDYESYYKTTYPIIDIGNDEIVFVDNNGDFLHLPVNYYALIGGLIECQLIDLGYKSV